jgi:predicted protein tyrosine phosphatase
MRSKQRTRAPTRSALRRVLFVSQRQAEAMRPPQATALISITDPGKTLAALGEGWASILRIAFDDVDQMTFPGQDLHLSEITADQVAEIAAFCFAQSATCQRMVVHCRYGVSRSAAVAKAIAEALSLPFPADYDEYNRFVYLVLRRVLRRAVAEA